jgi:peptide/nickel transport system substrate-binding protein
MRTPPFARLWILAIIALVAVGCSSTEPVEPAASEAGAAPTTEEEPTTEAAEPSATEGTEEETEATEPEAAEGGGGGTLVVALSADPGGLNPAITTSGGTHTSSEIMYNGLLRFDEDQQPQPDLAESWEITDDGATYTFTLRDDVVWHDGEPFTSEDVKFTFENALLELHSRTAASMGGVLDSIDTPDDTTVVFSFSQPYAPLLQQLDVSEAPMLPAHVFEGEADILEAEANNAPVGTGPFRFVSYTPDSEIRLERNPDYFREGLPLLDEIVMQVIPEAANQVIALEAGEVDWLWGVPGPDLERLEATGDYEFLQTAANPGGSNCIMTVSFNLDRPILQDLAVRRAFAHALDREVYLERILFGAGRVAEAPIHSGITFAHAEGLDLPTFDLDMANSLLDEAGWIREGDGVRTAQGVEGVEDGTPLSLNFVAFPTFAAYGEVMREQLAAVGIELVLEPTEQTAFPERVFTDRDFDTNIISYCNGTDPEIGVRRMFLSTNIGPVPFSNSSGYVNEEVDALFDQARSEVDPEARGEVYRQIQEIVVEDLPYVWIVETEGTRVHTAACEGFFPFGLFAEEATCSG